MATFDGSELCGRDAAERPATEARLRDREDLLAFHEARVAARRQRAKPFPGASRVLRYMVRAGAVWCNIISMSVSKSSGRQSVSLPLPVARRVRALAKRQRVSANRVIVELIETGLEAREQEKRHFFDLADRLSKTTDTSEQARLKEELARLTFGE